MNITLIRQQMLGFAQITWRGQCTFKMLSGAGKIPGGQRHPSQTQLRPDMLPEWTTLSAFPWLKSAAADQPRRLVMPAGLIIEGAKLDAQIITLPDKVRIFFQP